MITVSNLLDHLSLHETFEIKKIEKIHKISNKAERKKLEIALTALSRLGIIEIHESGLLKLKEDHSLIKARLRCSSKGYCFAVRDDKKGDDIYVRDNFLNHAWNGDRVLVKITREAVRRRSPEGKVQCILERSSSNIPCLLDIENDDLLAIPLDDRILTSIQLNESDKPYFSEERKQNLFEVEIDRFPIAQYDAIGHIVRPLPLDAGNKGDIDILLTKNNLHKCIPSPKSAIKSPVEKNRRDLTNQETLIFRSWNSEDAPPLPAIHVVPFAGGMRLWIHSPSVAERVGIGNNLDNWLLEKGQAHCLGDMWKPLLNKNLTKACDFKVGSANKAISVQLDISSEGEVIDWEFFLSEIQPVAEVNCEHLTSIENRKPKSRTIPTILKPLKAQLVQIQSAIFTAQLLFKREKEEGLIELDLPTPDIKNLSELSWQEPGDEFNQWKLPLNQTDPQSILCPLLRAANKAFYRHIHQLNIPGLRIKSDSIDKNTLNDVVKSALALELKLELDEQGVTTASQLADLFAKNTSRRVLDKLLRNCLPTPKLTSCESQSNSTQEVEISPNGQLDRSAQAPWTCPTLNYYEIINQRIIIALLREGKSRPSARHKVTINLGKKDCCKEIDWPIFTPTTLLNLNKLTEERLVTRLNSQRRIAKSLRNGIVSMALARAIEPLVGQEMEAVISGVQSYGFFAEILPFMAEGLVHVSSLNDDWYEYRSRQSRLIGRKSKMIYQLGDMLKVKIIKVDILKNQIDLEVFEEKNSNDDTSKEIEQQDSLNTFTELVPVSIEETSI